MPYPRQNLTADEVVALDRHPHWVFFLEPVSALVAAIVLAIVVAVNAAGDGFVATSLRTVSIALLVVSGVWTLVRYLRWVTTHFVITSQRLIFREGILSRSGIEIPLERVNNVNFHQGVLERIIGAGDLLIESGGETGQQRFTDIKDPDDVQNLIITQVEQVYRRRSG